MLFRSGYTMGDRTLYLRLPNFHGNDVLQMQERLNILGFSCGKPDGCFGVYTEAAVKEFQESQGMLADGMAFQDTFDSIDRLQLDKEFAVSGISFDFHPGAKRYFEEVGVLK